MDGREGDLPVREAREHPRCIYATSVRKLPRLSGHASVVDPLHEVGGVVDPACGRRRATPWEAGLAFQVLQTLPDGASSPHAVSVQAAKVFEEGRARGARRCRTAGYPASFTSLSRSGTSPACQAAISPPNRRASCDRRRAPAARPTIWPGFTVA